MKTTTRFFMLLACLAGMSVSVQAQINQGMVAWYKLDGNTEDSSGFNNKGYPGSGVSLTTDKNGAANKAYSFDGTSGATIDAFASSSLNASAMTNMVMSAWIRPASGSSGFPNGTILMLLDPVTKSNYSLVYDLTNNKIKFDNFNGVSSTLTVAMVSNFTYGRDAWHHVAARVDSANHIALFINGVMDTTTTIAPVKPLNNTLTIGRNPSAAVANNWSFLGTIDEVRVYNRYLDNNEMMSLYTGINTGISARPATPRMQVYPNPARDYIQLTSGTPANVALYDMKGTLVKTFETAAPRMDISTLPAGLYLAHVRTAEGMQVVKVQKQ